MRMLSHAVMISPDVIYTRPQTPERSRAALSATKVNAKSNTTVHAVILGDGNSVRKSLFMAEIWISVDKDMKRNPQMV
jgi:hypothetical protein